MQPPPHPRGPTHSRPWFSPPPQKTQASETLYHTPKKTQVSELPPSSSSESPCSWTAEACGPPSSPKNPGVLGPLPLEDLDVRAPSLRTLPGNSGAHPANLLCNRPRNQGGSWRRGRGTQESGPLPAPGQHVLRPEGSRWRLPARASTSCFRRPAPNSTPLVEPRHPGSQLLWSHSVHPHPLAREPRCPSPPGLKPCSPPRCPGS